MVASLFRLALVAGLVPIEMGGMTSDRPRDATVIVDHLAVYDRPDERSYCAGQVARGDRVRIRGEAAGDWAAVEPPATAIGWIERGDLEPEDGPGGHRLDGPSPPARARVAVPRSEVRSGRPGARMPGPTWVELPRGAMVRLVDRPPMTIGRGPGATTWLAVVPPAGAACYVRADGLRPEPTQAEAAEVLASYQPTEGGGPKVSESLPPGVAAEVARVDAMHHAILSGQPIDQWRFDAVRADYQAILKRSGDSPAVEEALRTRLARVTRHEQAAAAAREFREVLARSRRRDEQVARLERRLTAADRYRTITYHAVGTVQPTSRLVDGRKLHALVGRDGKTVAYLDLPPGLDVESLGSARVGVRGAVHYRPELGTRLITVRDLEPVGTRR